MRDETALRRRIREQDGVITRPQVLACGFTDEWLEAQVTGGRWLRWTRKVYLTTTGTPTARQLDRLAVLTPGGAAALSHETAAVRWGMTRRGTGPSHVTVPYGSAAHQRTDVRVHRSRAFAHIVVDDTDLPTVSAADTCVDLAVAAPDAHAAMRTLLHAALSMRISGTRLLTVMELRRPRRYARALRDAAALLEAGVGSTLEARYAVDVEDAHGLPRARRQVEVPVGGDSRYEDCIYDTPGGETVVRIDGWRYHSDRHVAVVDRARDNAAQLAGRARLVFGWEEITGAPCRVAAMVASTAHQRGWSGAVRVCGAACEQSSVSGHG